MSKPYLRTTALHCVASIFRHFFLLQYRAAFLPGLIPVSRVDHPLDEKIPFLPGKVNVYLDFVAFWIRSLGFLLGFFRRRALEPVRKFLKSMGNIYAWAAEVYGKNLSTTERPFYIKRLRFLFIHILDPHLMCIPSLHVMVVIRTYTLFREILRNLGEDERCVPQADELRRGALAITEAVLYVKQHSVNCIPAALYSMTKFDPQLFPPDEAEFFVSQLFSGSTDVSDRQDKRAPKKEDSYAIREYILSLYRRFMAQAESSANWKDPLIDFLKEQPSF